ncbi:MAG: tyrosine-type recombinase/integrase [Planctomycetaceae bacterium]|nr:tyrosine-type recombinase/integrase [Planctomycetaceae bacterium]
MLDQLFVRPQALAFHQEAPLLEERCSFLAHLSERGLRRSRLIRVAELLLVLITKLELAKRSGDVVSRDEILRVTKAREPARSLAIRWLRFLGRLHEEAPAISPYAKQVAAFAEYMKHERGFASETIRLRCWLLPRILNRLKVQKSSLRDVTPGHVDEALQQMLDDGKYSRVTVRDWAGVLRLFFRFAESQNWCRKGLANSIQGPRIYSQASLPTGPSWDEVRQLLAMTEGTCPSDIRDRAILMLFAIYGLRTGDVKRLRLDDFDWEHETLTVAISKSGRGRLCPLDRTVGDAVLNYLRTVRPHSRHREVFLTLRAPFWPLRDMYSIVAKRLRLVSPLLPRKGPHALRHACATHLLSNGLSLKEIGDHLGHRDPDATRIYAKVDLNGLREVADFDLGGLA